MRQIKMNHMTMMIHVGSRTLCWTSRHTGNNYSVIHHQQISYQNQLRSISCSVSVSV